jgi:hypothetical protein
MNETKAQAPDINASTRHQIAPHSKGVSSEPTPPAPSVPHNCGTAGLPPSYGRPRSRLASAEVVRALFRWFPAVRGQRLPQWHHDIRSHAAIPEHFYNCDESVLIIRGAAAASSRDWHPVETGTHRSSPPGSRTSFKTPPPPKNCASSGPTHPSTRTAQSWLPASSPASMKNTVRTSAKRAAQLRKWRT